MRKFLLNILYFTLPVLLLMYGFDAFLSSHLKQSNSYAQKEYPSWNALMNGTINSDVLIYGSSRASVHISPSILESKIHSSCYNLGIDGHNFWLQYLRHKLLIKNNPKPKLIIYSLDIYTLQKKKELYNPDQFLPYMLWNEDIENSTSSYEGYKLPDYKIPLIRYYGKTEAIKAALKCFVNPKNNPIERIKGYQGQDIPWNSDFDKAKLKMKTYKIKFDTASIKLFDTFIKECKANNIKLVFVYSPEYIEGQQFTENRADVFRLYNQFSTTYSIPFYDFSKHPISFDKQNFYNTAHMNKRTAEFFTSLLSDSLIHSNILEKK